MLRVRFLLVVVVLGALTGFLAVGFRLSLSWAESRRLQFLAWSETLGWLGWPPYLIGVVATGVAGIALVRSLAPETAGSGIPHVKAALLGYRPIRWARILVVKFVAGVLAIGSGLALGREGPTVQMGAAVGKLLSLGRFPGESKRWLIAIGSGAGLASAFNAPLAGVLFVMEELGLGLQAGLAFVALVGTVGADTVCRMALGQEPVFGDLRHATPHLASIPFFLVLGVATGILGIAFNRILLLTLSAMQSARTKWGFWPVTLLLLAGLATASRGSPHLAGGGESLINSLLSGSALELPLIVLLMGRFAVSIGSYATGSAGGIFAPLLAVGGLAGGVVSELLWHTEFGWLVDPHAMVIAGMCGLFTAVLRAPITGMTLAIAMTNASQLGYFLLATCLTAYFVAELAREKPLYEALLQRDLQADPPPNQS